MGGVLISLIRALGSFFAWLWETRDRTRVVVLGAMLLVVLSNLRSMRRVESYGEASRAKARRRGLPAAGATDGGEGLPFVSLLVPARNEELNVEACVSSLLQQDYPHFEVLVLDDGSTDRTPQILAGLAAGDERLTVLKGRRLPAGWLGKHWACHQLTQASRGELLLFTDADTEHHPQMLRAAVAAQRAEGSDMLTGLPREETVTWGEKAIVPIIDWAMFSLLPMGLAKRMKSPLVSIAIGQFMLFRRSSLLTMGGFEAVRGDPVDDVALARLTKRLGMQWRFVDLTGRVRCRMYRGLRGAVDGFAKSILPSVMNKVWVLVVLCALLGWMYLAPLGTSLSRLVGVSSGAAGLYWALAAIGLSLVSSLVIACRVGASWRRAFLYPLTMGAIMGICVRSVVQFRRGHAVWKDRVLPALREDPPLK
jgi:chlorobactene glucosyltransferase